MMSIKEDVKGLVGDLKAYLETRYDLARLSVAESTALVSAVVLSTIVLTMLVFLALLFLSVGFGFWLISASVSPELAFTVVGLGYVAVGIVVFAFRKTLIIKPLLNVVIQHVLPDETGGADDDAV